MTKVLLNQLSFKREEQIIFQQVDHEFETGTFTLLRGDSGCGKSTLLRLISGFTDLAHEGSIVIDGKKQGSLSIYEKVSQVGMVFQKPNTQFTMRSLRREITFALENLSLGYEAIQGRMEKAVHLTNTAHLLDREIVSLSGGEKQRASLTVLLAMDAPILLLDEPFASIDSSSRYQLIHLLGKLRDLGKTIILCDHDLVGYEGVVDEVIILTQRGLKKESISLLGRHEKPQLSRVRSGKSTLLEFQQVSYQQGKRELLEATNYSFNQGITTITGDNGVGKSTLFRAIVQQQRYQGKMFFEDRRMKKRKALYKEVTLAVQEAAHQFIQLTPREELAFNSHLSQEMKQKQENVLEELGLTSKLDGSLFHLSEGQKKMIQLTTMLSLDRKLLLLDEPFTGLDEKACQLFMDWMEEKSDEQSFMIISHRLAPLNHRSDEHVLLNHKRLNFQGETHRQEEIGYEYSQNQFA